METASVTEKAGSHAIEVGSHHDISSPEISPTSRNKDWGTIMAICIPMALICFFIWLDEAILATAIPRVSDEFQSFAQIGWYGPSYLFGLCASQLPFGRAYKDSPSKITYLFSLFVFEVASIVQGAAPSSEAFIAGRIFAGIGGSGVLTGTLTIFSEEISKARLPYVMGIFGFIHSLGGIAGPVIGGAITTSSLTWRWYVGPLLNWLHHTIKQITYCRCFYLNPIISFVAVIPILVLWRGKFLSALDDGQSSTKIALLKFDYLGILSFAAAIVALLLGLQLGSSNQSWSDGRTIAVLTLAIVLMLIFAAVEWWKGDNAILPKGIAGERVVLLSSIYTATLDGAYFVLAYQVSPVTRPDPGLN
jgi:MFS family permease